MLVFYLMSLISEQNLIPLWSFLDAGNHNGDNCHFDRLLNEEVPEEVHHHGRQPLVGPSVTKADSIKSNKTHPTCGGR